MKAALVAACLGLTSASCAPAPGPDPLVVYAAASTRPVVDAAIAALERDRDIRVTVNYAASGTLARQIERGAPAHLFVSAHPEWIDRLESAGLLAGETRRVLFHNTLVVAAPSDGPATLDASWLPEGVSEPRLVTADPAHVPLGRYARTALEHAGAWRHWLPRLLLTADAPSAARLLALGEADLGVIYASDAAGSSRIVVLRTFDANTHAPIEYTAVAIEAHAHGRAFLEAFASPSGRAWVTDAGFLP